MSQKSKDFNVAIIGGGMGGLALAVGLIRGGVKVDIFEQAPKFEEIGAGVGLGPNAVRALRPLGILDAVLERVDEPLGQRPFIFISGLPGHEDIFDYPALPSDYGVGLHRAHFLDSLVHLIPQDIAHFGKKCNGVSSLPSGELRVSFEDGSTHTANVVVGCDGIKSVIRSAVVGHPADVKFTRTVAYRGLIPTKDAIAAVDERIAQRPVLFTGLDRHIVAFPIKKRELINIVAFSTDRSRPAEEQAPAPGEPWVIPSTQAEMLSQYEGWGPKAVDLLKNIEKPNKWFLHALDPPLDSYVKGKIVLLGDAAHSMLPHLGAGAGQAMEDAFVLCQLLAHPLTNASNIEPVLRAYDVVRRPRANHVLTSSFEMGELYEHHGPSGGTTEGLRKDLDGIWEWVWHHDVNEEFQQAVTLLEDGNVFVHSSSS